MGSRPPTSPRPQDFPAGGAVGCRSSRTSPSPAIPHVYALGDTANIAGHDGNDTPQLGSVAQQSGQWAAKNILADLEGKHTTAFHYKDKGIMAMIGRGAAVAEVGEHRHELHGTFAFAAWLGVHAAFLSGTRQKIDAFISWGWDYFSKTRTSALLNQSEGTQIDWGDDEDEELQTERPQRPQAPPGRRQDGRHLDLTLNHDRMAPRQCRPQGDIVPEHYDVIIIGTGAGGGTLAHTLANSGKRILILERGNFLPREMENWSPDDVFVEGRYISKDTWFDSDGQSFQPQVHYYVGGATKLYGAALYRLRPEDFGEMRHVDGISPAWPVSYDEFEPWYTKAEWLYQVHGKHGEDPTEGSWSKQYPWPPVSHEPRIQEISDALAAKGYHPFWAPCGILLDEAQSERSLCIRCASCDGYPCMVHAKADAEVIAVRPLLGMENVTLLVNAEAVKLETDASGGSVTSVVVERDGVEERYEADIVAVAAGAANSAKLLLRSANDAHPGTRERLRPGGPKLHVPQLQGGGRPWKGDQRHLLPEDPGDQRLLSGR